MKVGRPSKLRVLVITLLFSSVMVLGQTKRADASDARLVGFLFVGAAIAALVAVAATIVTVKGVACTPIAAAKGSDYPGGFSGAFGDCFSFDLKSDQTAPAGEKDDASDILAEEEEANRNNDGHQEE